MRPVCYCGIDLVTVVRKPEQRDQGFNLLGWLSPAWHLIWVHHYHAGPSLGASFALSFSLVARVSINAIAKRALVLPSPGPGAS